MNNKKLSRLLEPNLKLYFLCMALFCLLALFLIRTVLERFGGSPADQ